MFADEDPAGSDDPLVRAGEVADQHVEMRGGTGGITAGPEPPSGLPVPWNESRWPCGGGSSVTQPEYHCTGVPPSSPAQNPAMPRILAIQHDLTDPADRARCVSAVSAG